MKNLTVLGSTGSIGVSTLDVVARHPDKFTVVALSAHSRTEELFRQCFRFKPKFAVMHDADNAELLRKKITQAGLPTEVMAGPAALEQIASLPEVHAVMAAIVGAAGLQPTLAAARAGKTVMLANKEALVMSGGIMMDLVKQRGATLLPIDSEHNAVFQSLPHNFADGMGKAGVRKIVLTASGGPFRQADAATMARVTPEQACAHPNWVMGRKISVDSATMMNKGLEVIEAHWLFNCGADQIDIVIHPQSVIHSMVQYTDGSVIAQLGNPDMRTPIAYALGYPERIDAGVDMLDLIKTARLDFEPCDRSRFPCVELAYQALNRGGTAPAILNAANEIAVEQFLQHKLAFISIAKLIEATLERVSVSPVHILQDVLNADDTARRTAAELSRKMNATV
ncbi:MAG: 1-deoxy-D-xylulose-5-phosphate reductoisomerase [Burkholderiales bacterium]